MNKYKISYSINGESRTEWNNDKELSKKRAEELAESGYHVTVFDESNDLSKIVCGGYTSETDFLVSSDTSLR